MFGRNHSQRLILILPTLGEDPKTLEGCFLKKPQKVTMPLCYLGPEASDGSLAFDGNSSNTTYMLN